MITEPPNKPQRCMLWHSHGGGMSFYFFDYVPSAEMPHPDVAKMVEKLGICYQPEKGERLFLETPSSGQTRTLSAAEASLDHPKNTTTARR